jgi:hypothetical protein
MSVADLLSVEYEALTPMTKLGDGAQATVYRVAYRWDGGPSPLVYKEFKTEARDGLDIEILHELISWQESAGDESLHRIGAWPLRSVTRDGQVTGFLMREAPPEHHVELTLIKGRRQRRLFEVQHVLNSDHVLAERGLPISDRWRLEFLRSVAWSLSRLHRADLAVGDISPKNLLAARDGHRSYLLDCDSVSIRGRSVLPQYETPDWEVPEARKATAASDRFKLGLLAIRLYAGDQSVRDPGALSRAGGDLVELARRALEGPTVRPPAEDWLPALDSAIDRASSALPSARSSRPVEPRPGVPARGPTPPARPPVPSRGPGRPRRRRRGWIVTLAVAAIGVTLYANPASLRPFTGSLGDQIQTWKEEPAASSPADQAAAVDQVMEQSVRDRKDVQKGVKMLRDCSRTRTGHRYLLGATQGRADALHRAQQLEVSGLANGDEFKRQFVRALDLSQQADEAYVRWSTRRISAECAKRTLSSADYRAAQRLSRKAGVAKVAALKLWTPTAVAYGLPARTRNDI